MKPGELPKQIDDAIAGVVTFLYGLIGTLTGVAFRPVGQAVERLRRRKSAISSTTYLAVVSAAVASISTWGRDALESLRATGHVIAEQKDGLQALVIKAIVIYAVCDLIARLASLGGGRLRLRRRIWAAICRYAIATSLALAMLGLLAVYYAVAPGSGLKARTPGGLLTVVLCAIAIVGMLPGSVAISAALLSDRPRSVRNGFAAAVSVMLAWLFCVAGARGFVNLETVLLSLTEPAPEIELMAAECQPTPPHQVEVWVVALNKGGAPAVVGSKSVMVTLAAASDHILLRPVEAPVVVIKPGQTTVVHLSGASDRTLDASEGLVCEVAGIDRAFAFKKAAYYVPPGARQIPGLPQTPIKAPAP